MYWATVALCAAVALWSAPAYAQLDWRIDAALSRIKPAGLARYSSAAALAGFAQQRYESVSPFLSGAATIAGDSIAAAQVAFGAAVVPKWSTRVPFDVGAVMALYGIAQGDRGNSRAVYARQHFLRERGGYWLGAAIAQVTRSNTFSSHAFDAGGWLASENARVIAAVASTRTSDRAIFDGTSLEADPVAARFRTTDGTLTLQYERGGFDFEGLAGARLGFEGLRGASAFAALSAGVRLFGRTRLVLSAGRQLADALRGTPEWRYFSVGVRVSSPSASASATRARVGPDVFAERVDSTSVRIRVESPPTAWRVEVAASFTGWQPTDLSSNGSAWVITLPISSGVHHIKIRINGGDWLPPGNRPVLDDEYGGRVGMLVVL